LDKITLEDETEFFDSGCFLVSLLVVKYWQNETSEFTEARGTPRTLPIAHASFFSSLVVINKLIYTSVYIDLRRFIDVQINYEDTSGTR
jgi:hypothetical protein